MYKIIACVLVSALIWIWALSDIGTGVGKAISSLNNALQTIGK